MSYCQIRRREYPPPAQVGPSAQEAAKRVDHSRDTRLLAAALFTEIENIAAGGR